MPISAALAAELAVLGQTLDDPTIDLADTLDQLATTVTLAVGSFLGLTMTTTVEDQPQLKLTVMKDNNGESAAASLRMTWSPDPGQPLSTDDPQVDRSGGTSVLILYGGTPGAFVDLAADIAWLRASQLTDVVLDQHLNPPDATAPSGLDEIVSINQALGVLLGRGYLPDEAVQHLDEWARLNGGDRLDAARHLLADLDDRDWSSDQLHLPPNST